MPPKHSHRRAEVYYSPLAAKQIQTIIEAEDEAAIHRLDRTLTVLSVDPERGAPLPDRMLRDYRDEREQTRVIYYVTAMATIVVVAYVEA